MSASLLASRAESLNAKVGAVTLAVAAFMTLLLSHVATSLAPLRILTLTVAAFAAWVFCDEMGLKKPLNRAGFVFFSIAATTKVQIALGLATQFVGRYYLLYSAFLLLAVLFWSLAFLHRQRELKVVGAVGILTTLLQPSSSGTLLSALVQLLGSSPYLPQLKEAHYRISVSSP